MASPQKENGYTAIANELLEKIISSGLNGTEIAVIFHILRKTYGYQKKEDEISLSQFILAIPSSKQSIVTALNNLQLVKIIRLVKKGTSKNSSNLWCFNKDYDSWQLVRKSRLVKKTKSTSQVFHNQLVKKTRHTKEIYKINIQNKDISETGSPNIKSLYEKLGIPKQVKSVNLWQDEAANAVKHFIDGEEKRSSIFKCYKDNHYKARIAFSDCKELSKNSALYFLKVYNELIKK